MLEKIKKGLRNPGKLFNYAVYHFKKLSWDSYFNYLRDPKIKSSVPHSEPAIKGRIIEELKNNSFDVRELKIDIDDYKRYLESAGYYHFRGYYAGGKAKNFFKKSLEHYLAAKFLGLSESDIYIDIANAGSPVPEIYSKLFGCKTYRQDLVFPKGLKGNRIGGDAGNLPLEDGFATKMALHCSFEHFEQDSDIRFIKEAYRVLRKAGKLCIVPLYLFDKYAIQTDPAALPTGGMPFESDAVLYCAKGWRGRHGRFYDIPHLVARVRNNLSNDFKLTIYVVRNSTDVDPSCHVNFMSLFEKR